MMNTKAKTESTSLVVLEETNIRAFFIERQNVDQILAQVREVATNFTPDVTTKKGRDLIASRAYSVARTKSYLDGVGKELVDAEKEIPKRIDATRKFIKDNLQALQDEVRSPLDAYEAEEKQRIADLEDWLNELSNNVNVANAPDATSQLIQELIDGVNAVVVDDSWAEYKLKAHDAKAYVLAKLCESLIAKQKHEAEQIELERLRQEKAQREQEERERQIAEKARVEAEQKVLREKIEAEQREQAAKDAQAKAEQDAKDAQERLIREQEESAERERVAVEQAAERERQRIAQEESDRKAEEERRAANGEHQRTFNREVIADMKQALPNLSDEDAITLLTAIVKRKVRHLSIQY